jgi:membrane protein YdbS with pleckstrin-like domain
MTEPNAPNSDEPRSPLSANMPHRPADDTEEVYYEGSPLLRGAVSKGVLWELLGLALIATPMVIAFTFHKHLPAGLFAALVVAGLLLVCIPPLRALTIRFRITNYRIDYERGVLGKDIDTLELWHVEDIQFNQSILDRILAIGTIKVMSHDQTTPVLVMHSLPHSRHLFDQLKQRIIAVKRQRGVLKMDTGT